MILSFANDQTRLLFETGVAAKALENVRSVARRKLDMLHYATELKDLMSPSGNRLEKLSGNRKGQYSIRINDQWRICFFWNKGAEQVEIVDYH